MNLKGFNIHEWEKEKLDDMIAYNRKQQNLKRMKEECKKAQEEGFKEGIEQGITEPL